jgi:chromosome partitioning protein
MKTITVANHKGGCGKTTTAISIGAALAEQGYRVLLVDLDPQAHATLGLGIRPDNRIKSIYEVLVHPKISVPAVVLNTRTTRMDLIPSNMLLSGAEIDLNRMLGKEWILNEKLRQVGNAYDFCITDPERPDSQYRGVDTRASTLLRLTGPALFTGDHRHCE